MALSAMWKEAQTHRVPCASTGEPQRADGAARNTPPPTSSCWRPLCGTRESPKGMARRGGRRQGRLVPNLRGPAEWEPHLMWLSICAWASASLNPLECDTTF